MSREVGAGVDLDGVQIWDRLIGLKKMLGNGDDHA